MGVPSPCHAFCLWGVHCLRAECHINSFGIDRSFREKQEPSPSSHRESHSSRLEVNYFLRKILGILEVHPTILNYHNYLKIKFVKITSRKTGKRKGSPLPGEDTYNESSIPYTTTIRVINMFPLLFQHNAPNMFQEYGGLNVDLNNSRGGG
ncbi:2623_t:CDS:2 [Entrophospora sp. SA101]|nr:2623_t:CDS:2 [Entrophospora sp. SA101]